MKLVLEVATLTEQCSDIRMENAEANVRKHGKSNRRKLIPSPGLGIQGPGVTLKARLQSGAEHRRND